MIESFGKKTPTHDDDFLRDEGFVFRNMIDLIKIYLTRVKKLDYTFHAQFMDNSEHLSESSKTAEATEKSETKSTV